MSVYQPGKVMRRERLVEILRAALVSGELRFARQAALTWLAAFPGDLEVALLQTQVLLAENLAAQAGAQAPGTPVPGTRVPRQQPPAQLMAALEMACRKDPFSAQAYRVLALASQGNDTARYAFALTALFVIDGKVPMQARLEPWGMALRQAYLAVEERNFPEADLRIQDALHYDPDLLQAAVLHLLVDRATLDPTTVHRLADIYHTRWPDCLPVSLVLAETYLELGREPEAVNLLHLCAASDTTGQTARWLWGEAHPYRSLWPEDPLIMFDLPIPAGVAAQMGWNFLPQGELPAAAELMVPGTASGSSGPLNAAGTASGSSGPLNAAGTASGSSGPLNAAETASGALPKPAAGGDVEESAGELDDEPLEEPADEPLEEPEELAEDADQDADAASADAEAAGAEDGGEPAEAEGTETQAGEAAQVEASAGAWAGAADEADPGADAEESGSAAEAKSRLAADRASALRRRRKKAGEASAAKKKSGTEKDRADTIQAVSSEFERLAKKLKKPDLGRVDGRQPMYVIFTSREGLLGQYGPQTTSVLDSELRKLAGLVRQRTGLGALIYYADDALCTEKYGLTPVNPRDPWQLKNALADLDGALGKQGAMIGALLIVGGERVVPFHRLPNPTDDTDGEVASDCPYACLGANYFVSDWPVGRLPGEKGPDAGLMLEQLRQMQRYHARRKPDKSFLGLNIGLAIRNLMERFFPNRQTTSFGYTAAVWRRSSLAVFRPIGAPHILQSSPPQDASSVDGERIAGSGLGYYNLHGLEDSPAWYGQRDPLEESGLPDYPVALTPGDLRRNGRPPRIIFSEACYGGLVSGKGEQESLALKFLALGALAVIGSTGIAYGSIGTPLTAADLFGNLFWQHLKAGQTVGDALVKARVDLIREMNRRQGFLDGEDQKTLISFVLYGDPLAAHDPVAVRKAVYRVKDHPLVKTVSDHTEPNAVPPQLSGEAMRQVKQIVADYLPGADLSSLHLARQSAPAEGAGEERKKTGPAGESAEVYAGAGKPNGRVVVTISKQVQVAEHVHRHYMRVTLDEAGKAVKLSTSR